MEYASHSNTRASTSLERSIVVAEVGEGRSSLFTARALSADHNMAGGGTPSVRRDSLRLDLLQSNGSHRSFPQTAQRTRSMESGYAILTRSDCEPQTRSTSDRSVLPHPPHTDRYIHRSISSGSSSSYVKIQSDSEQERQRTSPMAVGLLDSPEHSPGPVDETDPPFSRLPERAPEDVKKNPACTRESCIRLKKKFDDAMRANRTWEKHTRGLQAQLHTCHAEKDALQARLLRLTAEEEETQALRQQVAELRNNSVAASGRTHSNGDDGDMLDLRTELRAVHLASLQKDDKISALAKKVEELKEGCKQERLEKRKLEKAILKQQQDLIVARTGVDTFQQRFLNVTKEKDFLMYQLSRISEKSFPSDTE